METRPSTAASSHISPLNTAQANAIRVKTTNLEAITSGIFILTEGFATYPNLLSLYHSE